MKINTNSNAKKTTPWFDVKCREDIYQGALFRLAKRLTEGEVIEKEFDSFLGVDRYRFAIVPLRAELSAAKKERDRMRNCDNCEHGDGQYPCKAAPYGKHRAKCLEKNYELWQPRKGQS